MGGRVQRHNTKCFRKAGILNSELQLVSRSIEYDSFANFEADELYADSDELQGMISRMDGIQCCSADEFIQADDQLPVCQHFDEEGWDASFLDEIGRPKALHHNDGSNEDDSDADEYAFHSSVILQPRIKSFTEAIQHLTDVASFLDNKGFTTEATEVNHLTTSVTRLSYISYASRSKQSTLDAFLTTAEQ